ncbi:DUF6226 family protein [Actinoplanes sp. N902-109]|uniref:DUF6226 family protein n=1 Tax=Actinoplanes sp. (strain N902-109) TaxID=649831 RepID=UPI0003293DBC|nr:DUF6226 family protein [Actinoplanes sp. N902-109]AGL13998.1 hypothetical protein L083_0488 [Actinoplanes sp. N902-109]
MGDFEALPAPAGAPAHYHDLVEAAEALLDEVAARYVADRRETKEPLGTELYADIARTVWLLPRTPAAGPLAMAFPDSSSGVVLRLGRWFTQTLPGYDDDPAELRKLVLAHIEGGLWERIQRGLTGSVRETRLVGPEITISLAAPLTPAEARAARRAGFAAAVQWAPWPRRP